MRAAERTVGAVRDGLATLWAALLLFLIWLLVSNEESSNERTS